MERKYTLDEGYYIIGNDSMLSYIHRDELNEVDNISIFPIIRKVINNKRYYIALMPISVYCSISPLTSMFNESIIELLEKRWKCHSFDKKTICINNKKITSYYIEGFTRYHIIADESEYFTFISTTNNGSSIINLNVYVDPISSPNYATTDNAFFTFTSRDAICKSIEIPILVLGYDELEIM